MKLFYGGCGNYMVFAVAEDKQDAIAKIGQKLNAPFLPIDAEEIDGIDGYSIVPMPDATGSTTAGAPRHCKQCDFTCENQGELLKHYREVHPKGA